MPASEFQTSAMDAASIPRPNLSRPLLIALLLVLVTGWVFAEVPQMEFLHWDDGINVTENPLLHPPSLPNVARFWTEPYEQLYVPLVYTVWAVLARFAPPGFDPATGEPALDPRYFHLLNLVLHLLAVLVVFRILRRLVPNAWAAGLGALLFGIHPVQVEPVCWVTGLKDVLSGLLMLTAVWTFLCFRDAQAEDRKRRAALFYVLATGTYVLALLSKPAAVATPLIVAALDQWVLRRPLRSTAVLLVTWVALTLPLVFITQDAQSVSARVVTPWWARPFIAGDALAFYLWKLAVPLDLGMDYGRSPRYVLAHGWGYLTWIVPAALLVAAWLNREKRPLLLAAAAVFVGAVLPVSGLLPFDFQRFSTTADRYLYVALLGPALALAWLLDRLPSFRVLAACGGYLALLGALASLQTLHWKTDVSLYRHAAQVNPRSTVAHGNLGKVLLSQDRVEEALQPLETDVRLAPGDTEPHYNLAIALARLGRTEEAIREYREAIRLDPDNLAAHNNLGILLMDTGRDAEALAEFREVVRLDPSQGPAHYNLATLLLRLRRPEEAIREFQETLRLLPDDVPAHNNLGVVYLRTGRYAEAAAQFREVLRRVPDQAVARANLKLALKCLAEERSRVGGSATLSERR
jgi:protein O-mannosyl-transferase